MFFLLYMEPVLCGRAGSGAWKDIPECSNLGGWSRGILRYKRCVGTSSGSDRSDLRRGRKDIFGSGGVLSRKRYKAFGD